MSNSEKATVLLFEPGKYPKAVTIDAIPSGLHKAIGGEFNIIYPFGNDFCVVCRADLQAPGLQINRALRSADKRTEMTYGQLTSAFYAQESKMEDKHLLGHVVFTQDSFTKPYSEASRTYVISSDNKAFIPGMGGYSIYGSSLDGTDVCVRLEGYMAAEKGGKDGWKVEKCYLVEPGKEIQLIMRGPFLICDGSDRKIKSLSEIDRHMLHDKYYHPERIQEKAGYIEVETYRPKQRGHER